MKFFNTVHLLLAFLSCLSFIVCTGQDDLNTCKRVCDEDLLPRIDAMVRNESRSIYQYESIIPYWTTCQYRCFRCHLPGGIVAMKNMRNIYEKHTHVGMLGLTTLLSNMNAMTHSLKWSCYTLWQNAINDGDTTSTFS